MSREALRDKAGKLRVAGKVLCLSPDCRRLAPEITDVVEPSALAFDNQGRLLVAENGPDQQVRVYDRLESAPRCSRTFGTKGGVYADTPGEIGDRKLMPNIVGLGTDAQGNLYCRQRPLGLVRHGHPQVHAGGEDGLAAARRDGGGAVRKLRPDRSHAPVQQEHALRAGLVSAAGPGGHVERLQL